MTDTYNSYAHASLVLGIVSPFLAMMFGIGVLAAIPGLILGVIALRSSLKGIAITGIVLNAIGLLIGGILIYQLALSG